MDMQFKEHFILTWQQYFNNSELPIIFYYTDEAGHADLVKPGTHTCIMGSLVKVRRGASLAVNAESGICLGGIGIMGFPTAPQPDMEYFLSCGIPGKVEGERFKKSTELVKEYLSHSSKFEAPAKYLVFKSWDKLVTADNPEVVIFFARPDVLSGLYNLANFDTVDTNSVVAPWGSGCSSIVQDPYLEKDSANSRGVLGMFDSSARTFVAADELTFAVPFKRFVNMVANMEESFLITHAWKAIQKRIK